MRGGNAVLPDHGTRVCRVPAVRGSEAAARERHSDLVGVTSLKFTQT